MGLVLDRNWNAARNILAEGLDVLEASAGVWPRGERIVAGHGVRALGTLVTGSTRRSRSGEGEPLRRISPKTPEDHYHLHVTRGLTSYPREE